MKALLSRQPGGPDTLTLDEISEPLPGAGQVRVAVRACAVNYPDFLIIQDLYQFKPPRPFSPGAEVAGIVDAVGAGVDDVHIGDRVLLSPVRNGMAEKTVGEARNCWKIPQNMPFDEAASLLMTYGTTFHALKDRAAIKPGETLLVLGAAGGVGSAAVELGKAMGARVIAAVSSPEKAEAAKAWGADETLVYPSGPFDKDGKKALAGLFKAATPKDGVDVIYAAVGGDYAEAVDAKGSRKSYEPGDVLVIGDGDQGEVQKSAEPYSTMVAGIFATKPGVIGRRQSLLKDAQEIPMAMVGIVPTKVTAENGPVHRGDLLVTSSTTGYAMKGTDRSRLVGAVIGKAMGSLDSGTGVIEVLVTLQ